MTDEATPQPNEASRERVLHFEGFSVVVHERRLMVHGKAARLGARAFDVLMVLIDARDRIVSKTELLDRVWAGLVVEENNLQVQVSQLRKYCGSQAITTIPGRGYQFTAPSAEAVFPRGSEGLPLPNKRRSGETGQGNLPVSLPPLLGRRREVADVLLLLERHRWVTVSGAGGIGKTRLAEAVAQQWRGERQVWLVELASLSDPELVPSLIAQCVGASVIDAQDPFQAIASVLVDLDCLLVLDNCEHLAAAVTMAGERLLEWLPACRLLVTSQEILRHSQEAVFKLEPLEIPSSLDLHEAANAGAMQLLLARVNSHDRSFTYTADNIEAAARLCRELDGLPLAIELAAARVPVLGLNGVCARLNSVFRLLTGDARVRLRRHQTLRAAMDWSYDLLDANEQMLFRRLAVFCGSFSMEAIQHTAPDLGTDEWGVLDVLSSLVDKSLVQARGAERPRYQLLETARAYAMEKLALAGETEQVLEGHAHATLEVCRQAAVRRQPEAIWEEVANVRAAFHWSIGHEDIPTALALAIHTSAVLALGGLVGEVLDMLLMLEAWVEKDQSLPNRLVAQYWQWLGRFGHDGRLPAWRCVQVLARAEAMFREQRNWRHVHACLRMRAEALLDLGDVEQAEELMRSAREMDVQGHPISDRMRRLRVEGLLLMAKSNYPEALERFEQAVNMARVDGIQRYVATLTQDSAQCLLAGGDALGAEARFRYVLDSTATDQSSALAKAYARAGLMAALLIQERAHEARRVATDAVAPLKSCGILMPHLEVFAWLLASLGDSTLAGLLIEEAACFRHLSQTAGGAVDHMALERAKALSTFSDVGGNHSARNPLGESEIARILSAFLKLQTMPQGSPRPPPPSPAWQPQRTEAPAPCAMASAHAVSILVERDRGP